MRFLLATVCLVLFTAFADAGPLGIFGKRSSNSCASGSCSPVAATLPPQAAPVADQCGAAETGARRHRIRAFLSRLRRCH